MTEYETIDLLHKIGERLDVQWGFFVSIHMALLGGIIYVDRPLSLIEKIVALFVYLGFAALNYTISMSQSHQLLGAYKQLEAMAAAAGESVQPLLAYYGARQSSASWESYENITLTAHIVMAIVVIVSVIYDKPKSG